MLRSGSDKGHAEKGAPLGFRGTMQVGVALFSMFFGAGNLILSPLMGLQAGPNAAVATAGFLLSGVGLPIATIVAVSRAGTAGRLLDRIGRPFSLVYVTLVYLAIGPLLAIPRTASTSFEMVRPLLAGALDPAVAQLLFSVAFFGAALALALHPTRLVELLGKVTGPLLIGLLALMVGSQAVSPAGSPLAEPMPAFAAAPAVTGFLRGYQTLDLLASLAFGYVITISIGALGVEKPVDQARQVARSGIVAGLLMAVVYCALAYLGTRMGTVLPGARNGAELLSVASTMHFGTAGTVLTAAVFFIACFDVCIGLISSISEYFSQTFPRLSYRGSAFLIAGVSCVLANVGLDAILAYSVPVLMALYPMGICAMVMGLIPGSEGHRLLWRFIMAFAGAASTVTAVRDALAPGLPLPLDALPLASVGLGWVLPAVVGAVVGGLAEVARRRRERG